MHPNKHAHVLHMQLSTQALYTTSLVQKKQLKSHKLSSPGLYYCVIYAEMKKSCALLQAIRRVWELPGRDAVMPLTMQKDKQHCGTAMQCCASQALQCRVKPAPQSNNRETLYARSPCGKAGVKLVKHVPNLQTPATWRVDPCSTTTC